MKTQIRQASLRISLVIVILINIGCAQLPERMGTEMKEAGHLVIQDYGNFYSIKNIGRLFVGLETTGILAHTDADREIRDWYQDNLRNEDTDSVASFIKPFGNGRYIIPGFFGLAFVGKLAQNTTLGSFSQEWANRSLRTLIVGIPLLLFFQSALGGSRPSKGDSRWYPFEASQGVNGHSGHSFMGAAPFLSAAMMTENPYVKTIFYVGSTLCGLSRINDDKHYASQVIGGWWLAYLAAKSVNKTILSQITRVSLLPLVYHHGNGIGVSVNISF